MEYPTIRTQKYHLPDSCKSGSLVWLPWKFKKNRLNMKHEFKSGNEDDYCGVRGRNDAADTVRVFIAGNK